MRHAGEHAPTEMTGVGLLVQTSTTPTPWNIFHQKVFFVPGVWTTWQKKFCATRGKRFLWVLATSSVGAGAWLF